MLGLLVLIVAQAAPGSPDEHADVRQVLIEKYAATNALLARCDDEIAAMTGPPRPMLGLLLETIEYDGEPPHRATMIAGILSGSAAASADIRKGDQIVAIGSEPLDYEDGKAVLLYLSDYPDEVILTIGRATEQHQVTLHPHVIPCLERANRLFDANRWREHFRKLRTILAHQAADIPAMTTLDELKTAFENLQTAAQLADLMFEQMIEERVLIQATS